MPRLCTVVDEVMSPFLNGICCCQQDEGDELCLQELGFDRTQQVAINGRRSSRLSISRSIVQDSGLESLLFLIYILDLNLICKINILCKYADYLSQLCPQHSPSDLVDKFSHIVRWAEVNKLIINSSKTKEIVFRRPSLCHYIPPPPLMQIGQFGEAILLGVLLTPTLFMQSHVKYTISILNQRLYLLNQLRKQGLNISGLTQIFIALVVARFQYALPVLAGQLSADDLHKVDAVFYKACRWQLTSHTPNSADLIEQCDKHLLRADLNSIHCLHRMLPQRKICMDAI